MLALQVYHQSSNIRCSKMTALPSNNIKAIDTSRVVKNIRKACSKKKIKGCFPILTWLPHYDGTSFLCDILAGLTVGTTAVAQGLAYAIVAGLPPEYGLYSGIMGGFLYTIFGNCKNMSVGPTAMLSALIGKYVSGTSPDFAVLATFLAGAIQLSLAIFQLGFLVEFLSGPVIVGFVAAAALQVSTGQLKSLFGIRGKAGNSFAQSIYYFFANITDARLWDTVLGLSTILVLIVLKKMGEGCNTKDGTAKKIWRALALCRNAVVVIIGLIISYILHLVWNDTSVLTVIGHIAGGLPEMKLPPFSTTVGNTTYNFIDMVETLGPQSIVMPLIGILEVVVISKAFLSDSNFNATQEMIALGLCNLLGSFLSSMPVTGSFSRSALYEASGVRTPLAGVIVSLLVILSLSIFTSMFYFIPKPTLAALIILAVLSLVHVEEIAFLWKRSKREFAVFIITSVSCLTLGLEFGVIIGVLLELAIILYKSARPTIKVAMLKIGTNDVILISLPERASYCSAEYVRKTILKNIRSSNVGNFVIVDGTNMQSIDTTVASNLMIIFKDIDERQYQIVFLNFKPELQTMCMESNPKQKCKFVNGVTVDKFLQQGLLESV